MKVLFVCTGNTCRSSMAEAIAWDMAKKAGISEKIHFYSAGLAAYPGMPASNHAIKVMSQKNIDLTSHKANQITKEIVKEADFVLTMTKNHKKRISYLMPDYSNKVFTIKEFAFGNTQDDVCDPFGQTVEVYNKVSEEIKGALKEIFKKIENKI